MGKLARAIIGLIIGYAAGAAGGFALVSLLSRNVHDKSLEAVMTAFFATGPLGAVAGLVIGLMRGARSKAGGPSP